MQNTVPFWALSLALVIISLANPAFTRERSGSSNDLDQIANAVDGAESSHGKNPSMWRANPAGPQGPMQVTQKAAIDVGGGDRFDIEQNRAIGRAYLALLHRRYGNWSDAISAYNWGMGNLDNWIKGGRQSGKIVPAVALYLQRVLHESGLCVPSIALTEACQQQMIELSLQHHYTYKLLMPAMEESGRPLPALAASGRPLPDMAQSGRLLPGLEQSGRPLPRLGRSLVCHSLGAASTQPRTPGALNPYSIFASACR